MAPRGGAGDTGRRVPQRAVAVTARCHDAGPLNSLAFSTHGDELLSAGANGQLKSHKLRPASAGADAATGDSSSSRPAKEPVALEEGASRSDHSKAITAVAVSALGDLVATAALDHAVKLYSYPGLKFEGTVTRFTLPIRCLSFSASGSMLAAAGDDEGIKIISTLDRSIACILKGHDAPVLSVAFDPKNEFLASADADGTVCLWNLSSTKAVHVLKGAAPTVESADTAFSRNTVAWHPDGGLLAVPSRGGVVKCYDRDTAEEMLILEGEHAASITTVAWSPSGRYLATAAEDGQVLVWDADERLDLNSALLDSAVTGLAWCPGRNALATCTADGSIALWHCPVPGHMPLPCSAPPAANGAGPGSGAGAGSGPSTSQPGKVSREELLNFDDDEEFLAAADAAAAKYEERQRTEHPSPERSDRQPQNKSVEGQGEDPVQFQGGVPGTGDQPGQPRGRDAPQGQAKHKLPGRGSRGEGAGSGLDGAVGGRGHASHQPSPPSSKEQSWNGIQCLIQPAFQPGSTPEWLGGGDTAAAAHASNADEVDANPHKHKRFLAFNLLGCITSRPDAEFAHVEVDFHDTSAMPCRVPAMVDYYGFTMAALGPLGCVLASPGKSQPKQPSTLLYRPFSSWASNSDWTVRLSGEERVVAVALGQQWVAAATSSNMLRVFSDTGIQRFVFCLSGPAVTLVGQGSCLAVVTHTAPSHSSGHQNMEVAVYNVPQQALKWRAPLPLSPGASLTWLGFSAPSDAHSLQSRNLNGALSPATDGQGCGVGLATYDSKGIVRVFREEYGGCWVPIFSSEAERKSSAERHWMVGLDLNPHKECLVFVVCKAPETHPQVYPRPVLSELKASIPLLVSDVAGSEALESSLLHTSLQISQVRRQVEAAVVEGRDSEAQEQEDHLGTLETQLDKTLLRLLAAACKGDKLERAVELGSMLVLHKSLEGAVRLASALRLPVLAERLHVLLQDRRAREDLETAEVLATRSGRAGAEAAQHAGTASRGGDDAAGGEGQHKPPRGPPGGAKPATPQPKVGLVKSHHDQPRGSGGQQAPEVAEAPTPARQASGLGEGPESGHSSEPELASGGEATGPASDHASAKEQADPLRAGQRRKASAGKGGVGTSSRPSKSASKEPPATGPLENPFAKAPVNPFTKGAPSNAADVPKTPGAKERSNEAGASEFLTSLTAESSQGGAGGKRKASSETKGRFFKPKNKAST